MNKNRGMEKVFADTSVPTGEGTTANEEVVGKVLEVKDAGKGMKQVKVAVGTTIVLLLMSAADIDAQSVCGIEGIPEQMLKNSSAPISNTSGTSASVKILDGNYPSTLGVEDSGGEPGNFKGFSAGENGNMMTSPTTNLGVYDVRVNNITMGCVDTVQVAVVAVLPVNKGSESVDQVAPHTARLRWTTEQETNNRGFPIMKSNDGIDFEEMAFVESKSGDGNSNNTLTYELLDEECNGVTYYKIDQEDFDGRYTEGDILSVQCDINEVISIGPTLASDYINFDIQGDTEVTYDIILVSMSGRQLSGGEVTTNEIKVMNFPPDMADGAYNLMFIPQDKKSGAQVKSFKIMKID